MPHPEPGERWGILGGTFDPIHQGHITLARDIKAGKTLNGVLLVPSLHHPFKTGRAEASFDDRLKMARLAVEGERGLEVSDIELQQNLPGYTIDTIRALKDLYRDTAFCFIIGADNVKQMSEWRSPELIFNEVTVVAGNRPGFKPAGCDGIAARIEYVETSAVDVSSTEIRQAVRSGQDPKLLSRALKPEVLAYIKQRRLYQ